MSNSYKTFKNSIDKIISYIEKDNDVAILGIDYNHIIHYCLGSSENVAGNFNSDKNAGIRADLESVDIINNYFSNTDFYKHIDSKYCSFGEVMTNIFWLDGNFYSVSWNVPSYQEDCEYIDFLHTKIRLVREVKKVTYEYL